MDNLPAWINVALGFIAFAAIIAAAVVVITSSVRKAQHEEVENLAETRGKIIEDLRDKVNVLEKAVAKMEARVEYLESREIEIIIKGVVDGVVKELK